MLRYECMNDSSHVFKGRNGMLEGVNCPVCEGQVLANYFDNQVHNALPDYMTIRETERVHEAIKPLVDKMWRIINENKEELTEATVIYEMEIQLEELKKVYELEYGYSFDKR